MSDSATPTGTLVLVTGTGRSGTSTIAGSLHHLGLHVPGPYLGANESNPKGFFESTWAVRFHKRITAAARINDFDSRPGALQRAHDAVTPQMRSRLVSFLAEQSAGRSQMVVKDPRSVWAQQLWKQAAAEVGLDIVFLSMLRHPAEVVGSRISYYATKGDDDQQRRYETFSVARWVNNTLISERETRGERRTFVPYTDLLGDWRPVMARVGTELGLTFDTDLSARKQHPVDDFIDPALRRHTVTWEDLGVPDQLRELAEQVWQDHMVLCEHGGVDEEVSGRLDDLGRRYEQMFTEAASISHDATEEARDEARRAVQQRTGGREDGAGNGAGAGGHGGNGGAPAGEDRPLRDVSGRELLAAVGDRVARRLRRGRPGT